MFIEPEHSLLHLGAANHGVLSQNCGRHPQDRPAAEPPPLNQADHHPHILDHQRVPPVAAAPGGRCSGPIAGRHWRAVFAGPALVEPALDAFTLGTAIIGGTALRGSPLALDLPTTKRATQIPASGIARMRKKENAAVPAPGQAGAQMRLGPQH